MAAQSADAETLADALTAAYAHNPTLEAARADTRSVDEALPQARAGLLPQLSATGNISQRRVDSEFKDPPPSGPRATITNSRPGSYGVSVNQSVFDGGRNFGRIAQADANIKASQQLLRSTEQSILLQTIGVYMDVRRDAEIVNIRANNVDLLMRQVEEAQARFGVGQLTRTDVAQAQARLAGARAQLAQAQADLEASRASYAQVVGEAPGQLDAPPPPSALPTALDGAIQEGLSNNPTYARFQEVANAAKAQIVIDRSGLLPQLSINGSLNHGFEDRLPGVGDVDTAVATAQVSIPLYQGGAARSRVAQSRDALDRANFNVSAARRQVVTDVTTAWNDLLAARTTIESSRQQVEANQLAFEGAEQERQVGLRTTIEVLNAQQELLDSRVALVRADRDAYVTAHTLLQAMGALDPKTLGVNGPLYDPDKHRKAVQWRF
jgi:TolC family type I secretion outer membrane protein